MTTRKGTSSPRTSSRRSGELTAGARHTTPPAPGSNGRTIQTIGRYLIDRLQHYGVKDVFGIPGDFVLQFYGMLEDSDLRVIGTTREDCAGYAADAYARVHGIGAVCVTYCVGGLSVTNSIAGAYAEKSPLIVISGAPGMDERQTDPLLHHRVRDFSTQREVFEKITVASALLDDSLTAFREIDRCLEAAVRFKRPVYLELPRDRVHTEAIFPHKAHVERFRSQKGALRESIEESTDLIRAARQPVILAGVEVHRFGLREAVVALAERNQIPICSTLLGKSVVSEKHPLYMGIYEGAMGHDDVRQFVESSDCVILLGTFMTDINLGIFTADLDPGRCIYATSEKLRIGHHHFHDVLLADYVTRLSRRKIRSSSPAPPPIERSIPTEFQPVTDTAVTTQRLFQKINCVLEEAEESMVVIADTGDSLFGASDLQLSNHTEFLSAAYYTSMGFATPASVGVQVADRSLRPIVLVGDGAFQMTCLELSTGLKLQFNPIVVVLNNKGYTTERFLQEGPFNDIPNWNYHSLPDLLGGGQGFEVEHEADLQQAFTAALANRDSFSLINVHLDPHDISPALTRLTQRLSQHI